MITLNASHPHIQDWINVALDMQRNINHVWKNYFDWGWSNAEREDGLDNLYIKLENDYFIKYKFSDEDKIEFLSWIKRDAKGIPDHLLLVIQKNCPNHPMLKQVRVRFRLENMFIPGIYDPDEIVIEGPHSLKDLEKQLSNKPKRTT